MPLALGIFLHIYEKQEVDALIWVRRWKFHLKIIIFFSDIVFNLIIYHVIYIMCVEREKEKQQLNTFPPPFPTM